MSSKKKFFTRQDKHEVLKTAMEVGVAEAAEIAEVHHTTVYDWRKQLEALGEKVFLSYAPSTVGRGVKKITEEKEQSVLDMWDRCPGYGPSQVRNQLRRGYMTISIRLVEQIMKANGYTGVRKKPRAEEGNRFEVVVCQSGGGPGNILLSSLSSGKYLLPSMTKTMQRSYPLSNKGLGQLCNLVKEKGYVWRAHVILSSHLARAP